MFIDRKSDVNRDSVFLGRNGRRNSASLNGFWSHGHSAGSMGESDGSDQPREKSKNNIDGKSLSG